MFLVERHLCWLWRMQVGSGHFIKRLLPNCIGAEIDIIFVGTPLVGHTDNLQRLRELSTQNGVWLHVVGWVLTLEVIQ